MAVEKARKCGYRKMNGLYLVGPGWGVVCDRLPLKMESCPVCGGGIHPSLGFTWIQPKELYGRHDVNLFQPDDFGQLHPANCADHDMLCDLEFMPDKAGLMWVGTKFYTPDTFMDEAREMGISKRIPAIPADFVIGETWVLLGHRGAYFDGFKHLPGIFTAFRPVRIEKIVADDTPPEELEKLRKRGIVPVPVPRDDKDHQGSVYRKWKERHEESSDFLGKPLESGVSL